MEYREMAVLAFNTLNGLMICLAITVAGLGTYVWQTQIPLVSTWYENLVESQGLVSGLLGVLSSVLAWLGTFGVSDEKPKLISAYRGIFGILLIPTIVLAVMTLVYMPKWVTAADDDLHMHMEKYYNDSHSANLTDAIQLGFRCCGMKNLPKSYRDRQRLPTSCCDPLLFHVTKDISFCDEKYKFQETCEGMLTEHLANSVELLSSLLLLLAAFFIALLVDLHFVRRPSKVIRNTKPAVEEYMEASSAPSTVGKGAPPKEAKEKKPKPDRGKDSPQKAV